MDTSSSLGMPMSPQEISKRYKHQSLGCLGHPLLHQQKYQVFFQDTIFLLLHMLCIVLGASLLLFLVFFCFVCCSIWLDPSILVWDRDTLRFHYIEHSSFQSYCSASVLFCQYCVQLWFSTRILFRAYQFLYLCMIRSLVHIYFHL